MMNRQSIGFVGALLLFATACEQAEQVQDRFRDLTPYEVYQEGLSDAGLSETALGRDWLTAGQTAVDAAAPVSLPFEEEGFITPEDPGAMAYRVTIGRGQKLTAEVTLQSEDDTRVFVDLFRVPSSPDAPARPVISSDSVPGAFVHEPLRGGEYILRLQPELLRGGQYRVTLHLDAQLAFPVEGHSMRSAQSLWGVDRDGGRRSHEGVDIFARRGTPVLATSAGVVNRVNVTNLGGKVVWLRDPVRNANIYFAHLDSQYVQNGDRVQVGDTIGFVGNTGNARTTPPHLHFGVYRRGQGAVNPAPFITHPAGDLAELTVDLSHLGSTLRLRNDGIRLRSAPGLRSPVIRQLSEHTPLRVLGGSGEYYRVRLPDGIQGYVAARLTEDASQPVGRQAIVAGAETVLAAPTLGAPAVARLNQGTQVPVLGRFDGFIYVVGPDGSPGWVEDAQQQQ
jgi:murein DD-endopeptidase MepM/ murein hydrolase activator NlpD